MFCFSNTIYLCISMSIWFHTFYEKIKFREKCINHCRISITICILMLFYLHRITTWQSLAVFLRIIRFLAKLCSPTYQHSMHHNYIELWEKCQTNYELKSKTVIQSISINVPSGKMEIVCKCETSKCHSLTQSWKCINMNYLLMEIEV